MEEHLRMKLTKENIDLESFLHQRIQNLCQNISTETLKQYVVNQFQHTIGYPIINY